MNKLPKHIRLAYLTEMALRRLSKVKNVKKALALHTKLVRELKLDWLAEDVHGVVYKGHIRTFKNPRWSTYA